MLCEGALNYATVYVTECPVVVSYCICLFAAFCVFLMRLEPGSN